MATTGATIGNALLADPTIREKIQLTIRPWEERDALPLQGLLLAYILDLYQVGGDFLPTQRNIEQFLKIGMTGAAQGEPCLVADIAPDLKAGIGVLIPAGLIGFTLWVEIANQFDLREKILQGFGTYVLPAYRRIGIAGKLRVEANRVATVAGYDRSDGIALDERGTTSAVKAGCEITGVYLRQRCRR